MKVWIEGMDDTSLSVAKVFSSPENVVGYWQREYGLSEEMADSLRKDARAMLNGTSCSASIGLCKYIDGLDTVFLRAVPVEVDEYYERTKETEEA